LTFLSRDRFLALAARLWYVRRVRAWILSLNLIACSSALPSAPNTAPSVVVRAPACALAGEEIQIDASPSTDAEGRIRSYELIFGDGTPARRTTDPRVSHVYDGQGAYEIRVAAEDDRGAVGYATFVVRVLAKVTCITTAECGEGEACERGACRPVADGGLCAPAPVCAPCGTTTNLCGPTQSCAAGCCIEATSADAGSATNDAGCAATDAGCARAGVP
jgi:hypothetical protein